MKNRTKLLSGLILVLMACGNGRQLADAGLIKEAILPESTEKYERGAMTEIKTVTLEKNILSIGVLYNGGCGEHSFELVGQKAIMKSMPPKRNIQLFHENNGDLCREAVTDTLQFDISPFKGDYKEIHLNLNGWKGSIVYK